MKIVITNVVCLLPRAIVLALIFVCFFIFYPDVRVQASGGCSAPSDQCNNWGNCALICGVTDCWSACTCLDSGSGGNYGCCDTNEYVCNNGCCPIGSGDSCACGTNAAGACKSCGGGGECNGGGVNCPAGYTAAWNQPIAVGCRNPTDRNPVQMCGTPGSAQLISGCCGTGKTDENGDFYCGNYEMTRYNCCAPGTEDTCTIVDQGTNYTIRRTTAMQYACSDDYDVYLSSVQSNELERRYKTCDGDWDENAEKCKGGMVWVYVYYMDVTCHDYARVCTCASTCSAPTAPTLSSPADGAQLSTTSVGLYWNAATFSSGCIGSYKVYIGTANPPTGSPITVDSTTSNITFVGTRGTTYYWYVRAENGGVGANSGVRSFTILNDQIAGQVFYDPNNTCGGSGWSTGGVSVSVDGGSGTAVGGTGVYSVTAAIGSSHTLSVNIPEGYACSTGTGCNSCSRSGIASPSSGNNFYLTDSRESWWQAEGAGIYAGGTGGVRSILPSSSLRLILAPPGSTEGLLMTSTGTVDIGESGSVSDSGWRAVSKYRGKKMDYDYFAANMGVVRGQDSDWQSDTLNLQTDDGRDFWYMDPVSSTAIIGAGSPWNVSGGDRHVIFVNGNLDINSDIVVEPGSFLAIIVKGDLTVDPSVADLQGLYVIDGSFVTETQYVEGVIDDIQLETGGTIVAWGSLSLSRSLGTGNITVPAEKFVYRSDLLTNMPDKMKTFVMQWNEVVPGTFQ